MKRLVLTFFPLFTVLLCTICLAQREQPLEKLDAKGSVYYEIRAENPNGDPGGGVVVLPGANRWAKYMTVTASGYWMVADHDKGAHIDAAGHDIGGGSRPPPKPGPRNAFKLPSAPPFSLIGMWECFDSQRGRIIPLSKLFYIGRGGNFLVPAKAPFGTSFDIHIRYFCNDDLYSDNAGELRVYQSYSDK